MTEKLTKKAREAVEKAQQVATGQPLDLNPVQRLRQAALHPGGPEVVAQVKLSDKVHSDVGFKTYRDIVRMNCRVIIVDGEVLLKQAHAYYDGVWASGWYGTVDPDTVMGRDKAIIGRIKEMADEMQKLSDALGRTPPSEAEYLRQQAQRDRVRLKRAADEVARIRGHTVGCKLANKNKIAQAAAETLLVIDAEMQRLREEYMPKREEEDSG